MQAEEQYPGFSLEAIQSALRREQKCMLSDGRATGTQYGSPLELGTRVILTFTFTFTLLQA